MPRQSRIVALEYPHHITQRGNYCQRVFEKDEDRKRYLYWIAEYAGKYKLSLLAYCLMDNHVHFIAIPHRKESLAMTFNMAHMRYAQYFNRRKKLKGHLWQGRFYSCVLDNSHLVMAVRYAERNPVRAGTVKEPWEWPWSSALEHVGKNKGILQLENLFGLVDGDCDKWTEYISSEEKSELLGKMRNYTRTGFPIGGENFVKDLESKFKRRLGFLVRGRPKKGAVPN